VTTKPVPTDATAPSDGASGDPSDPALTFLFTDIESSTRGWEQQPEVMRTALEVHDAVTERVVTSHGGSVVKSTGDGALATFPDPLSSVVAAAQLVAAVAEVDHGGTDPMRIRVGIHTGDAQMRGGDVFGPSVNRTARIMSVASGGQIVVSEVVFERVSGRLPEGFSLRDLGMHRLKDLRGAHRLFQVCAPGLEMSFPPLHSLDLTPNNLPSQVSELLGREDEIIELRAMIDGGTTRLITLVGPGGTGKTRLGLQVAADQIDRFTDGVFLVDLATVSDVDGVAPALARVVATDERSEDAPPIVVARAIGERLILMMLDNFEQVVAAGPMIAGLLATCPRLVVLVTSREALRVRGEQVVEVSPLGLPPPDIEVSIDASMGYEAIQLFAVRAGEADASFRLDESNIADVVAICRRLDGLPLAIELAAARLKLFQPAELRRRLDERFDVLRGGAADLPERQRTLTSTIEWSYDLLTYHQRALLRSFSLFAGASLDSVEGVADLLDAVDSSMVLDDLESLVAKSLVRSERTPLGTRFSMLETIREFALARLHSDADEFASVRRAHATYYADLSNDLRVRLQGPDRNRALALASAGLGNLRAAWVFWVEQRDAVRLEELLETLWVLHDAEGQYHGAIELANDMLDVLGVSTDAADQARAAALQMSIARAIMAIKGYTAEVEEAFTRAIAAQDSSSESSQFPVLRSLASLYVLRAEMGKAFETGGVLLSMAEADHIPAHLVDAHLVLGSTLGFVDAIGGLAHLDAAIEAFDPDDVPEGGLRLGPHPGVISFCASAFFLWFLGHMDRADIRAARGVEVARHLDHPYSIAFALFHAALFDLWSGRVEPVKVRADELVVLAREHRWAIWEALAIVLHGFVDVASGRHEEGLATMERGIGLYESASAPPVFWPLLLNIRAKAFLIAGRPADSERMADGALAVLSDDNAMYIGSAVAKGSALAALGRTDEAVEWFETALALGRSLDLPTPTVMALMHVVEVRPSDELRNELEALLGRFTEGSDSPLLAQAAQVLAGQV
jgi:predicted ATPase/class 3 adenylate cyclase